MAGKRHFEDFAVGTVIALPPRRVSRAEIIAFAAEFDPQPFHLDERAPASDLAGGLFASGWHVCAVFMRMMCDAFLVDSACLGSPGIDRLKWQRPLRPGDVLAGTSTVLEARALRSRPEMGIVRFRHEAVNQAGEVVMWMENPVLFGRRETA
jgi:acyl dehydratase